MAFGVKTHYVALILQACLSLYDSWFEVWLRHFFRGWNRGTLKINGLLCVMFSIHFWVHFQYYSIINVLFSLFLNFYDVKGLKISQLAVLLGMEGQDARIKPLYRSDTIHKENISPKYEFPRLQDKEKLCLQIRSRLVRTKRSPRVVSKLTIRYFSMFLP